MRSLILLGLCSAVSFASPTAGDDLVLTSSAGQAHDSVGLSGELKASVAADGERLALGTGYATVGANAWQGSVTIWRRAAGVWSEEAVVSASDGEVADQLGTSVALSGDVLVSGAPRSSSTPDDWHDGEVWVHRFDGRAWQQEQRLAQPEPWINDMFGAAVAVHDDVIAVGVPFREESQVALESGGVATYRFDGSAWIHDDDLEGVGHESEFFGQSVAVHGEWLAVGAPNSAPFPAPAPTGAVFMFRRVEPFGWQFAQLLQAQEGVPLDDFGWSLAIDGDTLAVGDPAHGEHGAVFVFQRDANDVWQQQARLVVPTPGAFNHLGTFVDVRGDEVLAGTPVDTVAGAFMQGSAWSFRRSAGRWDAGTKLTASSDTAASDAFGAGVALLGDGAALLEPGALDGQGEVRVTPLPGAAWASLGHALLGGNDLPGSKQLGELTTGSALTLELDRALPGALAVLVVGADTLDAPFKGGVLVPTPTLLRSFPTDANGGVRLDLLWPAGVPAGFEVFTQWWIADPAGPSGFAASNAVRGTAG